VDKIHCNLTFGVGWLVRENCERTGKEKLTPGPVKGPFTEDSQGEKRGHGICLKGKIVKGETGLRLPQTKDRRGKKTEGTQEEEMNCKNHLPDRKKKFKQY